MTVYDDQNIFAKILRGEIPCNKIAESAHFLAFHDIAPQAAVHVLVIPTGAFVSFTDFTAHASADEILGFWRGVELVAARLELVNPGFRLISNHGGHANQEVPHFHVHILGGQNLGALLGT